MGILVFTLARISFLKTDRPHETMKVLVGMIRDLEEVLHSLFFF